MHYLLYLTIALQVADILTTIYAIQLGKGVEGNGILAPFFNTVGLVPGLLISKGVFVVLLLWAAPLVPLEVLGLVTGFYVWVIYNNIKVLLK